MYWCSSWKDFFHKNFLSVASYFFGKLEIRTLTPNRFKNQTNDSLKLLGHNSKHQQRFFKQKIVAVDCCSILKFPKHFYCDYYIIKAVL